MPGSDGQKNVRWYSQRQNDSREYTTRVTQRIVGGISLSKKQKGQNDQKSAEKRP